VVERDGAAVETLAAPHVVLATGARPRTLPGLEPDGERVWTYREAMLPTRLPGALLIVGAGAIGVEFASFYQDMGSAVTLVEALPRILPAEDEEIAAAAHKSFARRGIAIHAGATVQSLHGAADGVTAVIDLGDGATSPVTVAAVILAVGITGNVEGIGLETTRVRVEKGHIVVDPWLATDEPGVYAIGDVVGPPWLAHKASHEGVVCVERIAGVADVHPLDAGNIPACTYCRPQIASVGLTEAAARAGGREVRVGRFPYQANGKAIALGEPEGMVKTVFDAATGELLGAHLFGAEATELIHGFAIARTLEGTEAELVRTVLPHPTLSEMVGESALDALGRALHI
jgi:dihydrolipoamide dehydrogenase